MSSFFKNAFKRILSVGLGGKKKSLRPTYVRSLPTTDVKDGKTPRYPPFVNGFPTSEVQDILESQAELIERIRMALGFNLPDFDRLLLPVLRNYAGFVHLLPASEAHHHRGEGGLFRHGLEVAFAAAQASDGVVFSIVGTPMEKRTNEPRWRLASTIAGLLHDVGKPFSDMSITDENGIAWDPYSESIPEWAAKNNIDRYFLRWHDDRHKNHESYPGLVIDRMLPVVTRTFITQPPAPEIMRSLLDALNGKGVDNPVTKLMIFADTDSVRRDLKQNRLNVDEYAYGVPVERYVIDAIRRLVSSGKWKVNEPGAKVWHLHQGLFIAWRSLGDMYDLISRDKIPGIPKDPDTLADILIERGFAIQNIVVESGVEATYRYWEVQPEGIPIKILMLRFDSHELVFTNEPPLAMSATIAGETVSSATAMKETVSLSDAGTDAGHDDCVDDADEEVDSSDVDAEILQKTESITSEIDALFGDIGVAGVLDMLHLSADIEKSTEENKESQDHQIESDKVVTVAPVKERDPVKIKAPKAKNAEKESTTTEDKVSHVKLLEPKQRRKSSTKKKSAEVSEVSEVSENPESPGDTLRGMIAKLPSAGPLLEKALLTILDGKKQLGTTVRIIGSQTIIPFPNGVKELGKQAEVINNLFDDGALETNPVMPGRKVQDVGGVKCLVLESKISAAFNAAMDDRGDIAPAPTNQPIKIENKENTDRATRAKPYTPLSTKLVKSSLKTLETIKKSVGKATEERAVSSTQNRTVSKPLERPIKAVQEKQSKKMTIAKVIYDEDFGTPDFETVLQLKNDEELISSVNQLEKMALSFKSMVIKDEGRWLVTPVTKNPDGTLSTSPQAVDMIALEHPAFSKVTIKRAMIRAGFTVTAKHLTLKAPVQKGTQS